MTFPLAALGVALAARNATWDELGLTWQVGPDEGEPVVKAEFASAPPAGDLTVLLNEVVALARDGTVPPAAMVGTYP